MSKVLFSHMNTPTPSSRLEELQIQSIQPSSPEVAEKEEITGELKQHLRTQIQKTIGLRSRSAPAYGDEKYPDDGVMKGVAAASERTSNWYEDLENLKQDLLLAEESRDVVLGNLKYLQDLFGKQAPLESGNEEQYIHKLFTAFLENPKEYTEGNLRDFLIYTEKGELTEVQQNIRTAIEQLIGIQEVVFEIEAAEKETLLKIQDTSANINRNASRATEVLSQKRDISEIIQQNAEFEFPETDPEELASFISQETSVEEELYVDRLWESGPKEHLEQAANQLIESYSALTEKLPDLEKEVDEAKETYHQALKEYKELAEKKVPFFGKGSFLKKREKVGELVKSSLEELTLKHRAFSTAISAAFSFVTDFHRGGKAFNTGASFAKEYHLPEAISGITNYHSGFFTYDEALSRQWKKVGKEHAGPQMTKDLEVIKEKILNIIPVSPDFPWIKKLNAQSASWEEMPNIPRKTS